MSDSERIARRVRADIEQRGDPADVGWTDAETAGDADDLFAYT